jgi:hypothetical protein
MKVTFFVVLLFGFAAECLANTNDDLFASQQILKLQQEFEVKTANFHKQSKDWPEFSQSTVSNLLASCTEQVRAIELEYLIKHPATNWLLGFNDLLVQAFVIRLSESNDLPSLSRLLASRCPEYIEVCPLEYWLAWKRGPQAIWILESAFFASGTHFSYRVLFDCFGRAFPFLRRSNMPSDGEYVRACAEWTRAHQTSCVLNYNYHRINGPVGQMEGNPPLFLLSGTNTNQGSGQ